MRLVIDAIVVSVEMLGLYFLAFLFVFLLAMFLNPIENRLSAMVWKHSSQEMQKNISKPTFKQFSQKHR